MQLCKSWPIFFSVAFLCLTNRFLETVGAEKAIEKLTDDQAEHLGKKRSVVGYKENNGGSSDVFPEERNEVRLDSSMPVQIDLEESDYRMHKTKMNGSLQSSQLAGKEKSNRLVVEGSRLFMIKPNDLNCWQVNWNRPEHEESEKHQDQRDEGDSHESNFSWVRLEHDGTDNSDWQLHSCRAQPGEKKLKTQVWLKTRDSQGQGGSVKPGSENRKKEFLKQLVEQEIRSPKLCWVDPDDDDDKPDSFKQMGWFEPDTDEEDDNGKSNAQGKFCWIAKDSHGGEKKKVRKHGWADPDSDSSDKRYPDIQEGSLESEERNYRSGSQIGRKKSQTSTPKTKPEVEIEKPELYSDQDTLDQKTQELHELHLGIIFGLKGGAKNKTNETVMHLLRQNGLRLNVIIPGKEFTEKVPQEESEEKVEDTTECPEEETTVTKPKVVNIKVELVTPSQSCVNRQRSHLKFIKKVRRVSDRGTTHKSWNWLGGLMSGTEPVRQTHLGRAAQLSKPERGMLRQTVQILGSEGFNSSRASSLKPTSSKYNY